uniref:Odorant receptor n=1 Tax=Yemma signatus TaxID=300820 RepID=A0A385H5Z3_9HEMI|nr:odorant receptor [Yemma signatus]
MERPFRLTRLLVGCGMTQDRPCLRYWLLARVMDFGILGITFTNLLYLLVGGGDQIYIGEALQCFVSSVHLDGKMANIRLRGKMFWKLLDDGERLWDDMVADPKNSEIALNVGKEIKLAEKVLLAVFLLPVPGLGSVTLLRNLTLSPEERDILFHLWDPFPHDWYWSKVMWEAAIMILALFMFSTYFVYLVVPCLLARGLVQSLVLKLEDDSVSVEDCVTLHQKIIKYVRDMNELMAGQMALEIICGAMQIAARGFQLILLLKQNDPRIFGVIMFLVCCFSGPYINCYAGHVITQTSEVLYRSCYDKNWYELPVKDQKAMYLMNLQASQLMVLQYRKTFIFNMERYGTVCQGTYSYLTLLTGRL